MSTLRIALMVGASAALIAAAPAPVKLQAHRALYDITMAQGGPAGGLAGVSGRMVLEFANSCDGFKTTQRMLADMSDSDEKTSRSDFLASTWESTDGRKFRFESTDTVDGKTMDHFGGQADGGPDSKSGHAVYEEPKDETVPLPADTLFPTEYSEKLIEAALAGQSTYSHLTFGGDDPKDIYQASAYIGKEEAGADADAKDNPLLKGLRSWPVIVSYYLGQSDTADYEMSFRLYENGVSTNITMSYPQFALKGRLVKLEPLPSHC